MDKQTPTQIASENIKRSRKIALVYFITNFMAFMCLPIGSYLFGLAITVQHSLIIPSIFFMVLGLFWNVYYLKNRTEEIYQKEKSNE